VPAATILVGLAISIPISAQTITTFDFPGAGTCPGEVWSIAPNCAVTGFYSTQTTWFNGVVREADGAALGLPKFTGQTPRRPMPLRKRQILSEIIAHERLRPALTRGGGVKPAILMSGPVSTAHEERIPVSIRLWCEAL
jgi:hypothetical protein